jgi:hypothetical protein
MGIEGGWSAVALVSRIARPKVEGVKLRPRRSELRQVIEIAGARKDTREIVQQLRPYLDLFKQQLPNWYHPYFPSDWASDYTEKTFQADKEWSSHAGQLLSKLTRCRPTIVAP